MKRKEKLYTKSLLELQVDMDRIIGFVERYFTKTSIILGVWGVIISIFFEKSVFEFIYKLYLNAINKLNVVAIAFIVFSVISICIFLCGIIHLIIVLIARAPRSKKDSKVFYTDIACNSLQEYKRKILNLTKEQVSDDYINQIYINSVLCKKKHKHYNRGLLLSVFGFLMFLISVFTGLLLI